MDRDMKCPECEITLQAIGFYTMAFLNGDGKAWCPECGHKWIEVSGSS